MEETFEFDVGNQVLAYDNGLLYNAKCLKRRKNEFGEIEYLIHYIGFKSKFDKWLDVYEVLVINDINMGHMDRLNTKVKNLRSYKKKNENNSSSPKEKGLKKRGRPRKIKSILTEPAVVQAIGETAGPAIPCVQVLIYRLNSINVPFSLRRTLVFDFMMNNKYHMCLKFPVDNCLAEVIHAFTQSSYFVDDSHKKLSTILCGTLIQYFNDNVIKLVLLDNEKRYKVHKKAKKYFKQRLKDRLDIISIFINLQVSNLSTKNIFACYVYGPMYLLRLLVNLPTILMRNSKLPDCDLDTFVLCIKGLYQFLEKNLDMYFPIDDYIKM